MSERRSSRSTNTIVAINMNATSGKLKGLADLDLDDRLIRVAGEVEFLLSRHVNRDGSSLCHTFDEPLGPASPLLKLLSPEHQHGLLQSLKEALQGVLADHGRQLANQFSLDDKDSAL